MKMTNKEYSKYVEQKSPKSKIVTNTVWAFCVGGGICVLGQALKALYEHLGMAEKPAGTAVSVTLIFVSALLTGLHLFDNIAKHAGAGSLIPITGFANAMVSPAMEYKSEGLVTGLAAKMFTIAGPVLVYGISASVIYGIVLTLLRFI